MEAQGGSPRRYLGVVSPFSILAIRGLGITVIVGADLEEAAATAARLDQWEFFLSLAPLQVEGGQGQSINPIAVF